MDKTSGYQLTKILSSDGAGLNHCFPSPQNSIGFSYSKEWHKRLMQEGAFPDGATAKESGIPLGVWTQEPASVKYQAEDQAHLSHLHIESEAL